MPNIKNVCGQVRYPTLSSWCRVGGTMVQFETLQVVKRSTQWWKEDRTIQQVLLLLWFHSNTWLVPFVSPLARRCTPCPNRHANIAQIGQELVQTISHPSRGCSKRHPMISCYWGVLHTTTPFAPLLFGLVVASLSPKVCRSKNTFFRWLTTWSTRLNVDFDTILPHCRYSVR